MNAAMRFADEDTGRVRIALLRCAMLGLVVWLAAAAGSCGTRLPRGEVDALRKVGEDGAGDAFDPSPTAACGDGVVSGNEQCEPGIESGHTCQSMGFAGGVLRCRNCRWDLSRCVPIPPKDIKLELEPYDVRRRRGRGSCPYVYLWNGTRYEYYTDLSGSVLAKGMHFFRPEFYGPNIYELGDFQPHQGGYRLRAREVIYEASFFDQAALLLVDVPVGYGVYNTWSFASQLLREPGRDFVTVRDPRPPIAAFSSDGEDVLAAVSTPDGIPLPVREDGLSRVVVDFGPIAHPERARLIVTAWGHYADLRDRQRPPFSAGTTIETRDERGEWKVRLVAGKSAGDARSWAVPIGGIPTGGDSSMRITMAHLPSVLDVLDAVRLDDSEPVEFEVTRASPQVADLRFGGAARVESSSLQNRIRADNSHLPPIPDALLSGRYTRYGDVGPLLESSDDRFVVMGHGDELLLEFDAPPLAPGMARFAFLEADVFYTLKYHPFGQVTDTNEPLPYHGMDRYPYDPASWPYRDDRDYQEYLTTWNTRVITPPFLYKFFRLSQKPTNISRTAPRKASP